MKNYKYYYYNTITISTCEETFRNEAASTVLEAKI